MLLTKRIKVTKQGFCKRLRRKLRLRRSLLLVPIQFRFQSHCHSSGWGGVGAYLSLIGRGRGWGWGGPFFVAGRLLTFPAFRMGAYSRWALIRGWTLIRINKVNSSRKTLLFWEYWAPTWPRGYKPRIPGNFLCRHQKCYPVKLCSVTEIAPKSPFLSVKRSPIPYNFRAGAKAIQAVVLWT